MNINGSVSINGKARRSVSSIYGKLGLSNETKCLNTEDLIKSLYTSVGHLLNNLLLNYSLGNIVEVKNELAQNYERIAVTIVNNSKPQYLYYEIMRILLAKTLDGLNQSIRYYLDLVEALSKLDICNTYKSILDDPVKLSAYINEMKNRQYLFNVEPITMIKSVIKPQYAIYIDLYGFPPNGIFETIKLGDILNKLEQGLAVTPI